MIPSPGWSGFSLGPITIHAYALCLILGIIAALWLTNRRWQARGGSEDDLWVIAMWAIPAGIIGGRLYHVISTPRPYFGADGDPMAVLYVWNGGLGIWGAVVLGALAAWWAARRHKISIGAFLDAAAPGLILAQAIGRWGNWFNQELFGAPTTLPWGLQIDYTHPNWPAGVPEGTVFHPTFLYESLWNIAGALLLIWLHRRLKLAHGQVFLLYICYYTLGRVWIEALRIDTAELILGVRLNVWVSILVFLAAAVVFALSWRKHRGAGDEIYLPGRETAGDAASGDVPSGDAASEASSDAPSDAAATKADAASQEPATESPDGEQTAEKSSLEASPPEDPEREDDPEHRFGAHGAMTSNIRIVPETTAGAADRPEPGTDEPGTAEPDSVGDDSPTEDRPKSTDN
ncbi:prolipoprotein diacylglyceryl transferase [Sediminivirga luteola]|uniref:prolipoprotein diacylglyceryl transferase n=1 Tax=Sediminivirga luteola TaxID=1774748 RepID=UPI001F561178|nr:prolipoprotein diacylglyceryl transferase [Sediminivirga luteola]MCI2264127.1 prolipoprotein diacylglyceryl transferase [Sediminivirga luteola]